MGNDRNGKFVKPGDPIRIRWDGAHRYGLVDGGIYILDAIDNLERFLIRDHPLPGWSTTVWELVEDQTACHCEKCKKRE